MNKRIYLLTTLLLVALLIAGCGFQVVVGSGKVTSETRSVGSFSAITLAGIGDVYVTQGEQVSVKIEAEDNLIPYFETVVQGNTLKIGVKPEYIGVNLRPTRPVKFYVTTPDLTAFTLAGSGNIFAGDVQATGFDINLLGSGNISTDSLSATNVSVKLAGSGDITVSSLAATEVTTTIAGSGNVRLAAVTADKVSSTTTGSGDISMDGKVTEQQVEIIGSGDYLGAGLKSQSATVRVTGSGNSHLSASDALDVTILGSGDVVYSGNPRLNASVSGSGRVSSAGE